MELFGDVNEGGIDDSGVEGTKQCQKADLEQDEPFEPAGPVLGNEH